MEEGLTLRANGRRPKFYGKWKTTTNCLAYLVPAFPEVGTAQPQLVMVLTMLTRGITFHLFFTRLEIIIEDRINFV